MRLVQATEEQKAARDRDTFPAWGQRLTLEQFLAREERLRAQAWAKRAMRTWLLLGERDEVLASCESFAQDSSVRGEPGKTHAIASVFTAPELRGRGHSTALLRLLLDRLRLEPGTQASTLFSDVGEPIYARNGYEPRPANDLVLPALGCDPREDVDELIGEGEVGDALYGLTPPKDGFVVWPGAEQLDWFHERERAYAELLGLKRPQAWGATLGTASIIWTADLKAGELSVLLMMANDTHVAATLLRSAQGEAGRTGLARVRMWIPSDALEWSRLGKVDRRDGGVPMIAPLAAGLKPDDWRFIPRALWV